MTLRRTERALVTVAAGLLALGGSVASMAPADAASKDNTAFKIQYIKHNFQPNQMWIASKLTRNGHAWKYHEIQVICFWDKGWHNGGSDYTDDLGRVHFRGDEPSDKVDDKMTCKLVAPATRTTKRAETRTFVIGTD
jgi:hypothetical protein